jgi:cytochrome P450
VDARLQAELREVLGGRAATLADIPKLIYTNMVFSEMLRLYPPVWILGRRTLATDRLPSGAEIPADVSVASMPYLAHRNPRYFPDPERFDPERFNPASQQQRPAFAYFPFGGGARSCIGEGFARMESVLILATIAQRYRLVPEPGQQFKPEPLLTYRLRRGNQMRVHRRAQSALAPAPMRAPAAELTSDAAVCGRSIFVNDQSHHCPGRSQSSV